MPKRVDQNQVLIVETFRKLGGRVQDIHDIGFGCPDLLVSCQNSRNTFVVEVKSEDGKQNMYELKWERSWFGHYYIIRTPEQAIMAYRLEDTIIKKGGA
jgi:hypothetical protein